MITGRLKRGWWPRAYAQNLGETWIMGVNIYNVEPPRRTDLHTYEYEFRCASEQVAKAGILELHTLLFAPETEIRGERPDTIIID